MFNSHELDEAKLVIDDLVQVAVPPKCGYSDVDFAQKLDRLAELVDALRYHIGYPSPARGTNVFQPSAICADRHDRTIVFRHDPVRESLDAHAAKRLALPLLDFLYSFPQGGSPILHTIRAFVRFWLPACRMLDFQRTESGVVRIETNVKFAAVELRRHGLLSYTGATAYKTWRLSLKGIFLARGIIQPKPGQQSSDPMWLGELFRRIDPRDVAARFADLDALARKAIYDQARLNSFLKLAGDTYKDLRNGLESNKATEAPGDIRVFIEETLAPLIESPEAEDVSLAFDPHIPVQTRML